jgi:hypothetical protein
LKDCTYGKISTFCGGVILITIFRLTLEAEEVPGPGIPTVSDCKRTADKTKEELEKAKKNAKAELDKCFERKNTLRSELPLIYAHQES